eukprot:tig00021073_g18046.t1
MQALALGRGQELAGTRSPSSSGLFAGHVPPEAAKTPSERKAVERSASDVVFPRSITLAWFVAAPGAHTAVLRA